MIFTVSEIAGDLRKALGMDPEPPRLLEAPHYRLDLDDVVRLHLPQVAADVILDAPWHLLGEGRPIDAPDITWCDGSSGWLPLPDDFLRLHTFEMDDWAMPVYAAISADDPAYRLQRSRWRGLRGSAERPVCAIAARPWGNVLEFYSSHSRRAQVRQATYIPSPTISDDAIDLPPRLYHSVLRELAREGRCGSA